MEHSTSSWACKVCFSYASYKYKCQPLIFLILGIPHDRYRFRLRGAPGDDEVDVKGVREVVGQAAFNYMTCHYFTRGSMFMVAVFYEKHQDDQQAFYAALTPRGLGGHVVSYLWHLLEAQWYSLTDRSSAMMT